MALQVVTNKSVKRGSVEIIDLMNKGLRRHSADMMTHPVQVEIIDLMNKGLRLEATKQLWKNYKVEIIDLMNKGLRRQRP